MSKFHRKGRTRPFSIIYPKHPEFPDGQDEFVEGTGRFAWDLYLTDQLRHGSHAHHRAEGRVLSDTGVREDRFPKKIRERAPEKEEWMLERQATNVPWSGQVVTKAEPSQKASGSTLIVSGFP